MTHHPPRILIVEDNQDHAFIVAKELTWDRQRPEYERVETPEAMEKALEDRGWDLIIADYTMPHFTGLEALKLVRDKGLDVPFIMVSGTQDEEFAVEAMRAGAQDFIPKQKLYRLSQVVKRELKEAKERRLRREAEKELDRREREFEAIVNNAPVGIVCYDRNLTCTYANPMTENLLGLSPALIRNKTLQEAGLTTSLERQLAVDVLETFSASQVLTREIDFDGPAGKRSLHLRLAPIAYGGKVEAALVILTDMTERREFEDRLKEARDRAEAANRAKSEFLAVMSHELRTPLNGVLGMTELALMSNIDDDARSYLGLAKQSGRLLLHLISDILDYAQVEGGRLKIHHNEFHLRKSLDLIIRPLQVTARDKGLQLFYSIDPELPERLSGDEKRLSQVLSNIIGNAIKFTDHGKLTFQVVEAGPDQLEGVLKEKKQIGLLFCIEDTGVGISQKDQEKIFESFTQVNHSKTRLYGGAGLGLAICKRLVELMGGRIWVESEPGKGSTFCFTSLFDLAQERAPDQGEVSRGHVSRSANPLKILVAEDNQINQIVLANLLRKKGHEVVLVEDGRGALEQLQRERFDLILMDVRMPVMDGLEATKRIRGGEVASVDPRIPIIALTAHALPDDRDRFLANGMDDYIAKPIEMEELDRVLTLFEKE